MSEAPYSPPERNLYEPDMTFYLRWVFTKPWHPEEPDHLLGWIRDIKANSPVKFLEMYTEWEKKYDAIAEEELAAARETAAKEKPGTKQSSASKPRDVGTKRCLDLLDKLLTKIEKKVSV